MIVKSLHIRNFRCLLDAELPCDCLTALVGRNGSGKSSFLRALDLFYSPTLVFSKEDFYAEDTAKDIEIEVVFTELDAEEEELFAPYLQDGELAVVRMLSLAEGKRSGKYHGASLQNPDFVSIRTAGSATDIRAKYSEARQQPQYSDLPSVRSKAKVFEALDAWEADHPDRCERQRDNGQFFGFTQVGRGYLGRHTRFIRIPAVRDAAEDATEGKGSPISEIMDLVVRSAIAGRKDLATLKAETQARYEDIMDPEKLVELAGLQGRLAGTLKTYVPDASVQLNWEEADSIDFPLPKAGVKLVEDGYSSTVPRTGHGLQRTFILTMLQHLAVARESQPSTEPRSCPEGKIPEGQQDLRLPNLILGIEEPEIYQHPSRQRHMASVLLKLAANTIPGVAKRTQVLYATHSPLFVGVDRFDQIRLLRKVTFPPGDTERPKITRVSRIAADTVAEQLWELDGERGARYTGDTLMPRLQAIMTPWMNEGFFADTIVLVEGEGDRAAILGAAAAKGHDLESMGICVVPCMGKENLDRPWFIFRGLGISVYAVWDSDHGNKNAKPDRNRRLCRLVNCSEEDWPEGVCDCHASFKCNLEEALRNELTADLYDRLLGDLREEYGMKGKDQARKNAHVIRRLIDAAGKKGKSSPTLNGIVDEVLEMRKKAALA